MTTCFDYEALNPDVLLDAVEAALGTPMSGLAHPLNSYINRVYELQALDRTRYIAKFYRPGRWSAQAIQDEHDFVLQCAEAEIPVVAPLPLANGKTWDRTHDILFAVFPKKRGRELEPLTDEDWRRLGRVVARVHMAGAQAEAAGRIHMHPAHSTTQDVQELLGGDLVSAMHRREFDELTREILDLITPLFDDCETIRIHGDCHCGNLLERPDEGLMIIDFDDMAMGPPVQDLWMLLPDHADKAKREINLILEGYEDFREFDDYSLCLIEPLRAMRILYFLAWCGRQIHDPKFRHNFPNWGTDAFWRKEIGDLRQQLHVIREHLPRDPSFGNR